MGPGSSDALKARDVQSGRKTASEMQSLHAKACTQSKLFLSKEQASKALPTTMGWMHPDAILQQSSKAAGNIAVFSKWCRDDLNILPIQISPQS